jgi:hypothetical protein
MLKVFRPAGLNRQLSAISFLTDKEYPFRLRSKGTYGFLLNQKACGNNQINTKYQNRKNKYIQITNIKYRPENRCWVEFPKAVAEGTQLYLM